MESSRIIYVYHGLYHIMDTPMSRPGGCLQDSSGKPRIRGGALPLDAIGCHWAIGCLGFFANPISLLLMLKAPSRL